MRMPPEQPVVGLTPFEAPDAALAIALVRAGALGVLDLGREPLAARTALAEVARRSGKPFAVRIADPALFDVELPSLVQVVLVPASLQRFAFEGRAVLAQVTNIEEARAAEAAGVSGLVVKGHEAGGAVGEVTSFVLFQRVIAETRLPVWVQGGIGLHSAAACLAGGARGVVVDSQLALLEDASTSEELRRVLAAMDGSETAVTNGVRHYTRPGAREEELRVPLGQDAAFAKPFADRFGTVERFVQAIKVGMRGHLRQARVLRPLARHGALAADLGTVFPIAQGPMTRVSDCAPFAEAVARAGALPFLALSLTHGAEARALLEQTRTRVEGRPWGVGVLGFVPPELQKEQLALISEMKPHVALIAGGRPSQARPLEKEGIVTFLHVPSPGLLDLFLKEGGRSFVFEGRECGGHVGPRSSFVLWDSMVERLIASEHVRDVRVLFAGGIHDARSARMVAALAAPICARGAKIGVLMGTAYLFTEEAVKTGAIGDTFQGEALRCDRTALLETAPGHATRCTDSPFVAAFTKERDRLEAEGIDAQTRWAALEQLNLGRLRIASKGLRRQGEEIVRTSAEEQQREGMFMIGQVAALRTARCTIDELHRDVCDASTAGLDDVVVPELPRGAFTDIAIVGMAAIFPDAPDLHAFWKNIVTGKNSVREVPKERWDPAIYFDPKGAGEKTPSKWGGFLPDTVFDPGVYGIPPRSLASIDPVQILALEVAKRALDDAGLSKKSFDRERASVVFGAEAGTDLANGYGFRGSFPQFVGALPPALDTALPKLTEDSFPGVLANVIAGRIANRLDFRGVNFTVDAACASSLTAVDVACKELATGSSDLVVAGGADLHNGIQDYLMFASVHALSPTGQSKPFDAKADGIALGEGVAAVVLKRLDDAERDGDRIYAVIKGVGGSSDGKSLGLTAPRREGQVRALERAWERAGLSPVSAGMVEAHGTGTVVGDRTELSTLTTFFGSAGATPQTSTLGSVKSQIGHTKCCAGMAGLIKAALAVHHAVLCPTKNVTAPNPAFDRDTSPFVLRDVAVPWCSDERVAAVSAFGFGGTNFHVVLASHRGADTPATPTIVDWPAELFVLRAETPEAVLRIVSALETAARSEVPPKLRDLAAGAASHNRTAPARIAFVAASHEDLLAKLDVVKTRRTDPNVHVVTPAGGKVAMLFPGQGSQRPGMLADLFVAFNELRDLTELARKWEKTLFPGAAFAPDQRTAQQRDITDTRVAQPVLGVVDLALARLFERTGVRPDMTAGHSFGELVALAVAGSFDAPSLVSLAEVRADAILAAAAGAPGTMAAVKATAERVRELLENEQDVVIANYNAPEQIVIAGTEIGVTRAMERLTAAGVASKKFPVACAFHSPVVAAAEHTFREELESLEVLPPAIPVFANATASPYPAEPTDVRRLLASQIGRPVLFAQQIEAMYEAGARVFIEAGPGAVLTDLVGKILKGRPHVAVACDRNDGAGLASFLGALAKLIGAGVSVDPTPLFARRATVVDLSEPVSYSAPATAWLVDGYRARPVKGDLPEFAMKPLAAPIGMGAGMGAGHAPSGDSREETVREYLGAMRDLVDAQREVMLRFLGESAPTARSPRAPRTIDVTAAIPVNTAIAAQEQPTLPELPQAKSTQTPLQLLITTVSARTGYPPEMLDADLDVEADLGIDSIKRIEILGELRHALGLSVDEGASDALVEQLAAVKTLRGIATLLEERGVGGGPPSGPATDRSLTATISARTSERQPGRESGRELDGAATPSSRELERVERPSVPPISGSLSERPPRILERRIVKVQTLPPPSMMNVRLAGKRFAIVTDARDVGQHVAVLLAREGAEAKLVGASEPLGAVDGLIYLPTLNQVTKNAVQELFARAQEAVRGLASWIIAATGLGGRFGHHEHERSMSSAAAGVSGFMKSLAKESSRLHVRALDLDPTEDPVQLAQYVFRELLSADDVVDVGYAQGERHTLVATPRPTSIPPPAPVAINRDSVVLLTGGGRGITAQIAIAMARRFQCVIELVGRSKLSEESDPEIDAAPDAVSLRKLLITRVNGAGPLQPQVIEARVKEILSSREINATLAEVRAAGGRASYHAVDVRDDTTFSALIDTIKAKHGHIDGVVHGAGLIEDKLLSDKSPDSFQRVFATKVAGARTLARKLANETAFFVLFSSVSGAFGNRGQTDYAAANDALDKLAHSLHGTVRARVLSINWGPWRNVGMVGPELAREYERRAIGLIDPEDGVAKFFDELFASSDPQVILTASGTAGDEAGEP
jgi:acyl transferase domain-containing protein/NAD(P)H-dependent flavin oxidoreductase YrpB (nitropropane dioxygenase family)/NAD(P)-dependent dehydrogenase (short-subunit alcohol dehydrogenase family)